MNDSKLIELYCSLSQQEAKKLKKFLHSSYFNESKIICDLHEYIINHLNKNEKYLERQIVYKKLFDDAFNYGKLRYFMSRLLQLIEQFLLLEQNITSPELFQVEFIHELKKRGTAKNYLSKINRLKVKEQADKISDHYFLDEYREETILMEYHSDNIGLYTNYLEENLKNSIEHLDRYYLIQKLKHFCAILNHQNILNLDFEILFKSEILQKIREPAYREVLHIKIYSLILKSLTNPEEEKNFTQLKEILIQSPPPFITSELKEIFAYAQNYCIKKINAGNELYLQEIFDLYKSGLEQEILLEGNQISERNYKNITVTGLRLNEFNWVYEFIHKYRDLIIEDKRENAFIYNIAKYYFYKNDYRNVLELLQKVEYNDLFYGIDSRSMLMKTYYELDEYEALDSFMASFTIFLNRKKIVSEHHRKANLNLIKLLKKLISIPASDQLKVKAILKKADQITPLADKSWLAAKISERIR